MEEATGTRSLDEVGVSWGEELRDNEILRLFFWLQRKVTTSPKIMLLSDVETEKVREGLFLLRPEDFTIFHTR